MGDARDVDLERAEAAAEPGKRGGVEVLAGEAQHAMGAERGQQGGGVGLGQRAGKVDPGDPWRRAPGRSG